VNVVNVKSENLLGPRNGPSQTLTLKPPAFACWVNRKSGLICCQLAELKPPNEYRLFNFDFVDVNFDDFYRCQVVLKMFLEIDVIDKFKLSMEVCCCFLSVLHYTLCSVNN